MVRRALVGVWLRVSAGVVAGCLVFSQAWGAVELTPIEHTWLESALPVLRYAREQRMPLDIIVQPQLSPGETPIGMAYIDGRCKLVLSMRGNAQAQATLDRIPPGLTGPVIEAIAAHELGHCWRHLRQAWGSLPDGMRAVPLGAHLRPDQVELLTDMWRTRREEAYADLVGLAWTLRHHPTRYAEVHDWHVCFRADQAVKTGPHDTRVWVHLAGDKTRFMPAATIFEQVEELWKAGLLADD